VVHRLLQVSDTHLAARPDDGDDAAPAARRNWAALRPWLAAAGANALVHTGDLVRMLPETAEDRALAAAELAAVGGTRLVVPGNHDVGHGLLDDPGASVEGPITAARVAAHREAFGADRFAHELGAWLLLGINAHLLGTGMDEEGEQDEWLRATLRGAGGRPLALFLHLPLFLVDPDEPGDHATRTITVPPGRAGACSTPWGPACAWSRRVTSTSTAVPSWAASPTSGRPARRSPSRRSRTSCRWPTSSRRSPGSWSTA